MSDEREAKTADGAGGAASAEPVRREADLTEEEASQYDRQIRLWGLEAQTRLSRATVLVVGWRGLATEVIKNLVLAGVEGVDLMENQTDGVTEQDLGSGFFFRASDFETAESGRERAKVDRARERVQTLNPRVKVRACTKTVKALIEAGKEEQDSVCRRYTIVCVTDCSRKTMIALNEITRRVNVPLLAAGSIGLHGFVFADLLDHDYTVSKTQAGTTTVETVPARQQFVSLATALDSDWSQLGPKRIKKMSPVVLATLVLWEYRDRHDDYPPIGCKDDSVLDELIDLAGQVSARTKLPISMLGKDCTELSSIAFFAKADFPASCAVLGGILGQDVLNAISKRELPISNILFFDGDQCSGEIYPVGLSA